MMAGVFADREQVADRLDGAALQRAVLHLRRRHVRGNRPTAPLQGQLRSGRPGAGERHRPPGGPRPPPLEEAAAAALSEDCPQARAPTWPWENGRVAPPPPAHVGTGRPPLLARPATPRPARRLRRPLRAERPRGPGPLRA